MINTKVIKIGIIFISVILFLTAVLFFIGESYDRRKARDIAQQFYESYGRLNKQVIRELIPSEMMSDEHVAYFLSDEYFNSLEIIDYSLEAVKVTEVEKWIINGRY